jgi:hypothetical protein
MLSLPAASNWELGDYFSRHPGLSIPAQKTDISDYYQRH